MHVLPKTGSLRSFQLDLVFLNAALQAGGQTDLATQVQTELNAIKHQRIELERAEELELVAAATVSAEDASLDATFMSAAAHVRAHHPEEYGHYFPKAPSQVANGKIQDEIQATHTLIRQLNELPDTDAVRTEFAPRLTRTVEHLEHALTQKDEVLQGFAVVRAGLDRTRAQVNLKRIEIHGILQTRLKDKKLADRFFRPAAATSPISASPATPAPATT